MTELEKLKQQRDEIDRRIKELSGYWCGGNVRVFPTPGAKNEGKYSVHIGAYHLWSGVAKEELYKKLSQLQANIGEVLQRMDAERLANIPTETKGEENA